MDFNLLHGVWFFLSFFSVLFLLSIVVLYARDGMSISGDRIVDYTKSLS